MQSNLLQTALTYYDNNIQVIPLKNNSKEPIGYWKDLLYKPETKDYIINQFSDNNKNIGIIGGQISKNLFILDFDSKKTFDDLYKNHNSLKDLVNKTPIVETSRGYHLYLRAKNTIKTKRDNKLNIDIKSQGGYVVAPPSLHPSGQLYLFQDGFKDIYQLNDLKEIDFLNLETLDILETNNVLPDNNYNTLGLGKVLFDYLITGNKQNYKSRSEIEYSIVLKCISNGYSLLEIKEIFKRFAYSGSKVKQQTNYLESQLYPNALEYYKNNIPENHKIITQLYQIINNEFVFNNSRTQWNDKAVYNAILDISKNCNKLSHIDLSVRELSLKTNICNDTISKVLKRLTEYNLIKQEKKGNALYSSQYSLNENVIDKNGHTTTTCIVISMSDYVNENINKDINNYKKDYFIRGCLGKNGYVIIQEINKTFTPNHFKNVFTIQDISEKTKINYRTVNRIINKLYKSEIIFRTKEKKQYLFYITEIITDDKLKAITERYNTLGTYKKREYKIIQQRLNHKKSIENYNKDLKENK